jgi:hypothetical protein
LDDVRKPDFHDPVILEAGAFFTGLNFEDHIACFDVALGAIRFDVNSSILHSTSDATTIEIAAWSRLLRWCFRLRNILVHMQRGNKKEIDVKLKENIPSIRTAISQIHSDGHIDLTPVYASLYDFGLP